MRLLFVKERLGWPRASGHDVHCFHLMRALSEAGHDVSLATVTSTDPRAVEGLTLRLNQTLEDLGNGDRVRLQPLQERFRNYWGVDRWQIEAVRRAADDCQADAVIVVGLGVLPYLAALDGPLRVWYAGDEWVWHHLSQIRMTRTATWHNLREAAIKGLYEWSYGSLLDRAWVVSEADRRALGRFLGSRRVDVVANGVDGDHYRPSTQAQGPQTCVFWGRLDFGPNLQALDWFCTQVWPKVRTACPDARFTIYGFCPTDQAIALAKGEGISLIPDLPDLRDEIARHQIVVLPFVSGGGIKNKLLEAASMGRAIVCSPVAVNGVQGADASPVIVAKSSRQWSDALVRLWADSKERTKLGERARRWVLENHSWEAAARAVLEGLAAPNGGRIP